MAGQRRAAAGKPSGERAARDTRAGGHRPDGPRRDGGGAPAQTDRAAHLARLRAVVAPVVGEGGYDLEDLTLSRVGRRYLVRIAVDSDAGVDLDAVAELSRRISAALDAAEADGDELIAGEYELEVGSPGVDRPLTEPRHWRRRAGRLVQVRAGQRQLTGRITAADDTGVTLDVDGVPRRFNHDELGPGHIQVEFKRLADLAADDDLEDTDGPDEDEELAEDDLAHDDLTDDDDDEEEEDDEEGEDEA